MTSSQSFKIYEILSKHFNNPEEAKIVVQEIEQIVEEKVAAKRDFLLTKDDKVDLIEKMYKIKVETIIWIVSVGILQVVAAFLLRKF